MLKKSFALIMSLMMLLSIVIIPQGAVVSAETAATGPDNVIKAAINFTNGEEGVAKSVEMALYSLGFAYAPARLGLTGIEYCNGGPTATGAIPIRSTEWSLTYDYLLEDAVVGLGGIHMQQGIDWANAGNTTADLTAGAGAWQSTAISLASLGASDVWSKPIHGLAFSVNTTAAVDTSKTYNVYYKNLKIVNASGDTIYTLFDNSVTTAELNGQGWGAVANASMALSVVQDPLYKPNEKYAIKASVNFSNGEEGVAKTIDMALYSLGFAWSPAKLGLTGLDYSAGGAVAQGAIPIKGNDWVFKYEYFLEDEIAGLGGIFMQQGIDWGTAGNKGSDLAEGVGTWQSAEISLSSLGASDIWNKPMYAVAFSVNTTAAVDTSKTYNVYYKNLQIYNGAGEVVYTLFDDSVTTAELNPQVWTGNGNASMTLSVVKDPTTIIVPNKTNAIKAAVTFTNGEAGVEKKLNMALYSMGFAWSPAKLGLTGLDYSAGGAVAQGAIPIKGNDWVFKYEYMLEDDIAGLGGIEMQQGIDWLSASNSGSDLTAGVGTWQSAEISLSSLGASDIWNKPMYAVAFSVNTTAAVDTSKTYNVYYRNLQIYNGAGEVVYTLFDDSVTTQELNPEKWAENSGATMTLSVVTKGDVDGADGATADDLTALRKVLIKAAKSDLYTADINSDGVVDIRDLVNLKKKYI